ncbi:MAG: hypothetical protein ACOY3L_14330 [Pseudomonadota bacterium]
MSGFEIKVSPFPGPAASDAAGPANPPSPASGISPAATPAPASTSSLLPVGGSQEPGDIPGGLGLTAAQSRQLVEWAVQDGRLTREQADAMLKADGVQSAEQPAAGDGLLPPVSEQELAQRASQYQMPQIADDSGGYGKQAQEFDTTARTWLAAAGFDPDIGSSLAKRIGEVSDAWLKMDDNARELSRRSSEAMLQRTWGADCARNLALAQQFVRDLEAKRPGIIEFLEASGAGNDPTTINLIFGQARAHLHKRGAKWPPS